MLLSVICFLSVLSFCSTEKRVNLRKARGLSPHSSFSQNRHSRNFEKEKKSSFLKFGESLKRFKLKLMRFSTPNVRQKTSEDEEVVVHRADKDKIYYKENMPGAIFLQKGIFVLM